MIAFELKKEFPDILIDVAESFSSDMTVLAGKSGSGKSTLIKMIAGFMKPDEGYVKLADGIVFSNRRRINLQPEKRKIGYVPQSYLLFPHLNVFENVAFGLREENFSEKELAAKVAWVSELCNISPLKYRKSSELSGGEKQRVALARAIAIQPSFLLLDEPFSALDVQTRRHIRNEVMDILKQASIPSIMVTHDPMDALTFGKQVYIMEEGKIIQKGNFGQLRKHPSSRFVADFTGLPAYQGESQRQGNGLLSIKLNKNNDVKAIGNLEGKVLVYMDPADFSISKQFYESSAQNTFEGIVTEILDEGNGLCSLRLVGDISIKANISIDSLSKLKISIGERVFASIKASVIKVESFK